MAVKNLGKVVGADGKSAYQIWLDNGNTGTEQDFLNSLKGGGGTILDVQVDGKSVVTDGIANISLYALEKTLQDILTIIQGGELDELTISKIEELIVSYFENKTVEEVEG